MYVDQKPVALVQKRVALVPNRVAVVQETLGKPFLHLAKTLGSVTLGASPLARP